MRLKGDLIVSGFLVLQEGLYRVSSFRHGTHLLDVVMIMHITFFFSLN